jgi:hypothetical protein
MRPKSAATFLLLRTWFIWFWCASADSMTALSTAPAKSPSRACSAELLRIWCITASFSLTLLVMVRA